MGACRSIVSGVALLAPETEQPATTQPTSVRNPPLLPFAAYLVGFAPIDFSHLWRFVLLR